MASASFRPASVDSPAAGLAERREEIADTPDGLDEARLARVGLDPALATVPAGELSSLVGKRASADLTAGTLLSSVQVSATVVPGPGDSVVGVPISPGLMPVEPLASGDTVRLVRTGELPADATPAGPVEAKVLRVTAGDTQTVVDVVVAADKAVQLAGWAGSGKIALILDSRAR